jgi:hypothetical protein
MLTEIVEMLIEAAAWQLVAGLPANRFYSARTIGIAYYVASGDGRYLPPDLCR